MKSILISIKPKYVADILNGKKTIEIRKTMPKCDLPIDVYIYCTKGIHNLVKPKELDKYLLFTNGALKSVSETSLNGKVVAKFTLNKVEYFEREYSSRYIDDYYGDKGEPLNKKFYKKACLTEDELFDYIGSGSGYAWHISNLVIFDTPKELSEFNSYKKVHKCDVCPIERMCIGFCGKNTYSTILKPLTKAPQSMCYVQTEE